MANLTLFAQIFSFLPKENVDFAVAMADGGVAIGLRDEIESLQSTRRQYWLHDFCGWRECVIFVCEEFKQAFNYSAMKKLLLAFVLGVAGVSGVFAANPLAGEVADWDATYEQVEDKIMMHIIGNRIHLPSKTVGQYEATAQILDKLYGLDGEQATTAGMAQAAMVRLNETEYLNRLLWRYLEQLVKDPETMAMIKAENELVGKLYKADTKVIDSHLKAAGRPETDCLTVCQGTDAVLLEGYNRSLLALLHALTAEPNPELASYAVKTDADVAQAYDKFLQEKVGHGDVAATYDAEADRAAVVADCMAWYDWMDARRAVSARLTGRAKADYDTATATLMADRYKLLANGICGD